MYRPKRHHMLDALRGSMPARVDWTMPEKRLFVWLEFPLQVNTDSLLESTLKKNVAFIPGRRFYLEKIEEKQAETEFFLSQYCRN
jgi:DNA-binding transcriptional MocR family regulator